MANKIGRQEKYNKELQDKFDNLVLGLYLGDVRNLWSNYWNYGIVEQIALYLNLDMSTIYAWSYPKSLKYKEEFANTFAAWQIVTKALLHKLTPMIAKNAPALAIFLRKVKLGELEVNKHIYEGKIDMRESLEIKITHEIKEAEQLGIDTAEIEEVKSLMNELKMLPETEKIKNEKKAKSKKRKMRIRPKRPVRKENKEDVKNSIIPDEHLGLNPKVNNY